MLKSHREEPMISKKGVVLFVDTYHIWCQPLTRLAFVGGVPAERNAAYGPTPIAPEAFQAFIASA